MSVLCFKRFVWDKDGIPWSLYKYVANNVEFMIHNSLTMYNLSLI